MKTFVKINVKNGMSVLGFLSAFSLLGMENPDVLKRKGGVGEDCASKRTCKEYAILRYMNIPERTSQQICELVIWGFTTDDIATLTITNSHNPLEDLRIRGALDEGLIASRTGFQLLASEVLWPGGPGEADLLLLLPFLMALDASHINNEIYGVTLLQYCVSRHYYRAAQLLLAHPDVDMNIRSGSDDNALEAAIQARDIRMIALLLSAPRVQIRPRALLYARRAPALNAMFEALMAARYVGETTEANYLIYESGQANFVDPIPHFSPVMVNPQLLALYRSERRHEAPVEEPSDESVVIAPSTSENSETGEELPNIENERDRESKSRLDQTRVVSALLQMHHRS